MPQAAFIWETNIGQVANQVQSGLQRIARSISTAQGSIGGRNIGANFVAGLEGRFNQISTDLERNIQTSARRFNQALSGPGAFGGIEVAGQKGITSFRDATQIHLRNAQSQVSQLAREVALGLPEGLRDQLPQLQRAVREGADGLVRATDAYYGEAAAELAESRKRLRRRGVDVRGAQIPGARGATQFLTPEIQERFFRAAEFPEIERRARADLSSAELRERSAARSAVLGAAEGVTPFDVRQAEASIAKTQAAMEREIQQARRVMADIQANRDRAGRLADVEGARRTQRGTFIDAQGRQFVPGEFGGLVPERAPEGFNVEREYRNLIDAEQQTRAVRARAAEIELDNARTRQTELGRRLVGEFEAGQALATGRFVRDSQGRIFKTTAGGGFEPVRTPADRLRAQQAIARAEKKTANAKRKTAQSAQRAARQSRQRPGLQGVFDRAFGTTGLGGQEGRGLRGQDILTTGLSFSRYLISAAVFAGVYKTVVEIKEAILDYTDSLTDLEVALGNVDSAHQHFVDTLSESSRFVGENAGAAIDVAARGIRVFAGFDAVERQREVVGEQFTSAVTQLAVVTDQELAEAAGDTAATASSFDIAAGNFKRVTEAIVDAKNTLGAAPEDISQGLASISTQAQQAGFNLQETANIIALISARTDQPGRTVATRLARVFARGGGAQGREAFIRLNRQLGLQQQIDLTASFSDQLFQLARIFGDLSGEQQDYIITAIAGQKNTRELTALLTNADALLSSLGKAYQTAGAGADEFRRKTEDLMGEVTQIVGSFKNIVVEISESGFFDIFAAGIETLQPFLVGITELLRLYNAIPHALRTVIALTLEYLAAQKLLTYYRNAQAAGTAAAVSRTPAGRSTVFALRRQTALNAAIASRTGAPLISSAAVGTRPRLLARNIPNIRTWGRRWVRASTRMHAAVGAAATSLGTFTTSVTTAATTLRARFNAFFSRPLAAVGLAAVGAYAIKSVADTTVNQIKELNEARQLIGSGVDAGNLRAAAEARQRAAGELRASSGGIFGSLSNLLRGDPVGGAAGELERSAKQINAAADRIQEQRQQLAVSSEPAAAIDVTSPKGIAAGLQALERSGRDARTQLDALITAVSTLGEEAGAASDVLSTGQQIEFRNLLGTNVNQAIQARQDIARARDSIFTGDISELPGPIDLLFGRTDAQSRTNILASILGGRQSEEIVEKVNEKARNFLASTGGELDRQQQQLLADIIFQTVKQNIPRFDDLNAGEIETLKNDIQLAVSQTRSGVSEIEDLDVSLRAFIRNASKLVSSVGELATLEATIFGGGITGGAAGLTGGLASAPAHLRTPAELAGANARLDALLRIRETAIQEVREEEGKGGTRVTEFERTQLERLDAIILQARVDKREALRSDIETDSALFQSLLSENQEVARIDQQIQAVEQQLEITQEAGAESALLTKLNDLRAQRAQTVVERANAERLAAVDSRNEVASAAAEAQNAFASLQQIIESGGEGSAAYWEAFKQYREAQLAFAQAERARAAAARLAGVDPRDALGEAQAQLQNAYAELGGALQGTRAYYEAQRQVAERQLAVAEAQREISAAQRLALVDPRNELGVAQAELQNLFSELQGALAGTAEYYQIQRKIADQRLQLAELQRSIADAARRAGNDPRSELQSAADDLAQARDALEDALPGTQAFFEAQRSLNEAMVAYSDAQLEAASFARQVSIDLTDPVAVAREELQTAEAKLRAARNRGAPADVINELQVAVIKARADAKQAAFDQRLNDIQVARDLGRVSFQAYISYLEEEAQRLRAIADRTRQQQEMLNEVEQAIQAANEEMQGQFNIGDIDIPTPFEVRRAVQAKLIGGDGAVQPIAVGGPTSTFVTNSTNVEINGADLVAVKELIRQLLGSQQTQRNTVTTGGKI